jgi:hypothetical protein
MRRIVLALALSAIATGSIFAGSAAASGPAVPAKGLFEYECAGKGTITVSIPPAVKTRGAAQIVGVQGHIRPVSFTFILTDLRTGEELVNQTSFFGGGKSHLQQEATTCGFTFEAPASEFIPEGEFPENVEPTDILKLSVEGPVIINP